MKYTPLSLLLVVLSFLPAIGASVLNIEGMRWGFDEKPGWAGSFKLDLGGSSGNSDKFNAALGMLAQHRRDGAVNLFVFSADYAESGGTRDTNKQTVHVRHTQDWYDNMAWELFTQWQRDEFAGLTSRLLGGAGLRWDMLSARRREEGARLFLGSGAFYEHQVLSAEPDRNTVRANLYASGGVPVFEDASVSATLYFQPSFDDLDDHRIVTTLGFSVPVREDLSLEVSFNLTHNSRPAIQREKTDITYLTGVRWKF